MSGNMIIACIPTKLCPIAPVDQPGCEEEKCPECGQGMWVSSKKRLIRDGGVPCQCMECVIRSTNGEPRIIDISKAGHA